MQTEIEAKLKIDSLQEIEGKLLKLNAEFLDEQSQIDYYFDNEQSIFRKSDKALRLRRQKSQKCEKFFLTYKGPREKGQFKKRQEIDIEIADFNSAHNLLSALGYEKALVFEKKRRTYRLNQCKVALDQLPLLGTFLEIEGPDKEKISDVQQNLGLANLPHIPESYASLMTEKLLQFGKTQTEVFL